MHSDVLIISCDATGETTLLLGYCATDGCFEDNSSQCMHLVATVFLLVAT